MKQPTGFVNKDKHNHVCKLHKAIYGLKQFPRVWFEKFSNYLLEYGLTCSKRDTSLFVYINKSDIIILILYVDDMVLTWSNPSLIEHLLTALKEYFRLKDIGKLHYFLGIQATIMKEISFCLNKGTQKICWLLQA